MGNHGRVLLRTGLPRGGKRTTGVTLPAETITEEGLCVLQELPDAPSRIFGHVGDLDVSASYPNSEAALNTSKETTIRELIGIEGINEELFRMENMGISAGHVNAVPWCMNLLGFPDHLVVLDAFLQEHPDASMQVSYEKAKEEMHGDKAHFYRTPAMTIVRH